jgi:hypothetical protein
LSDSLTQQLRTVVVFARYGRVWTPVAGCQGAGAQKGGQAQAKRNDWRECRTRGLPGQGRKDYCHTGILLGREERYEPLPAGFLALKKLVIATKKIGVKNKPQ